MRKQKPIIFFLFVILFSFTHFVNFSWGESSSISTNEGPEPLEDDIKKIPLPLEIRKSMWDSCSNSWSDSIKSEKYFWETLHVQLLSNTPEFKSLSGKTSSINITSSITATSCPPMTGMDGIFMSNNDGVHKFKLAYDGDIFRYQIDNLFPPQYEGTLASPLKQFNAGLPIDVIRCDEGLYWVERTNGVPACMKQKSICVLMERELISRFYPPHPLLACET